MEKQEVVLQVGVKVLLKNKEGRYLLLRRNPEKYPEVGPKWDIPGGRIDPGSPLLDNLKREVKEETGLDLVMKPKLIAAQDILRLPGRHVVRLTFTGEIEGAPVIDEESMESKWFEAAELLAMSDSVLDSYLKELLDSGVVLL